MFCKEKQKPKKAHKNSPSFSSSLLDEICRSIDGNAESSDREKKSRSSRACLVEKWMENKENERIPAKKMEKNRVNNDVLFFSSNSSSSDSSSDMDFFSSSRKSVKKPKPVRTSVSPHPNRDHLSFDDSEEESKKSKSRAMKIYANLKKLKQPISPGMKLTSLINSFFAKKSKSKVFQEQSCPSPSSYSRPCMASNSSNLCENLTQRTVRFDPVSVVVDQESKPRGKKSVYGDRCGRPPLPPNVLKSKNRGVDEDGDEDDACSESSSDLFELDHLSLFGKSEEFCEELPVYKTTYFGKNRGLIR